MYVGDGDATLLLVEEKPRLFEEAIGDFVSVRLVIDFILEWYCLLVHNASIDKKGRNKGASTEKDMS